MSLLPQHSQSIRLDAFAALAQFVVADLSLIHFMRADAVTADVASNVALPNCTWPTVALNVDVALIVAAADAMTSVLTVHADAPLICADASRTRAAALVNADAALIVAAAVVTPTCRTGRTAGSGNNGCSSSYPRGSNDA